MRSTRRRSPVETGSAMLYSFRFYLTETAYHDSCHFPIIRIEGALTSTRAALTGGHKAAARAACGMPPDLGTSAGASVSSGRALKVFTVVDEFTRVALAVHGAHSITARTVRDVLPSCSLAMARRPS